MKIHIINKLGNGYSKSLKAFVHENDAKRELNKLNDVRNRIESVELEGGVDLLIPYSKAEQLCDRLYKDIQEAGGKELEPEIVKMINGLLGELGVKVIAPPGMATGPAKKEKLS